MEKLVWKYITEHDLIKEGQNIGVATSGGPDSMALLVCLSSLAKLRHFSICCVHFEHGIRGVRSLDDADFVVAYCDARHIPLFMGAADVPALAAGWGQSEETAAKRAREAYFDSLVRQGDIDLIATAHHQSDQAESILMHMLRGSGLSGLRGIHSRNGNMVRPFLCLSKKRVMEYVDEHAIPYVTDETNSNSAYRRNYVRNELLPAIEEHLNADVSAALVRLSVLAREDTDYLESRAGEAFQTIAAEKGDTVELDAEGLSALHNAIAGRVVLCAIRALHVTQDIEYAHVRAVLELAKKNHTGSRVNLSGSICAQMEYGKLVIGFTGREVDYRFEMRFDPEDKNILPDGSFITVSEATRLEKTAAGGNIECFDADKLPKAMTLRTRHYGDAIRPIGAGGGKKLKEYFIDKKLTRKEREQTPLLANGSDIIWVVGHTISEEYKVTDETKRILRLEYTPTGEG
ncbi:MAG TPA: tRNA lysidine(34) synthetase TilS [Clostridiales bacterium]|nr:tRNA lysidine(34) synthetase TilS [Clostridiales bacterium]